MGWSKVRNVSGNCVACGVWRKSLHRDHIIPRGLGGADDPENIQLLCANCHEDKTRDDISKITTARWAEKTPEERSEHARRAGQASWDRLTPDERSARVAQRNRMRWANMTEDERTDLIAKQQAGRDRARARR